MLRKTQYGKRKPKDVLTYKCFALVAYNHSLSLQASCLIPGPKFMIFYIPAHGFSLCRNRSYTPIMEVDSVTVLETFSHITDVMSYLFYERKLT